MTAIPVSRRLGLCHEPSRPPRGRPVIARISQMCDAAIRVRRAGYSHWVVAEFYRSIVSFVATCNVPTRPHDFDTSQRVDSAGRSLIGRPRAGQSERSARAETSKAVHRPALPPPASGRDRRKRQDRYRVRVIQLDPIGDIHRVAEGTELAAPRQPGGADNQRTGMHSDTDARRGNVAAGRSRFQLSMAARMAKPQEIASCRRDASGSAAIHIATAPSPT